MKEKFDVTGMSCSACSSHVEKSVSKLEGVHAVSVNLLTNSMQVEYDETKLGTENIIEAVEHAGYGASVKRSAEGNAVRRGRQGKHQIIGALGDGHNIVCHCDFV